MSTNNGVNGMGSRGIPHDKVYNLFFQVLHHVLFSQCIVLISWSVAMQVLVNKAVSLHTVSMWRKTVNVDGP